MGQGVQSARQGVSKVSQAKAQPTDLHLQPLVQTKHAFPVQTWTSCIRALKQKLITPKS